MAPSFFLSFWFYLGTSKSQSPEVPFFVLPRNSRVLESRGSLSFRPRNSGVPESWGFGSSYLGTLESQSPKVLFVFWPWNSKILESQGPFVVMTSEPWVPGVPRSCLWFSFRRVFGRLYIQVNEILSSFVQSNFSSLAPSHKPLVFQSSLSLGVCCFFDSPGWWIFPSCVFFLFSCPFVFVFIVLFPFLFGFWACPSFYLGTLGPQSFEFHPPFPPQNHGSLELWVSSLVSTSEPWVPRVLIFILHFHLRTLGPWSFEFHLPCWPRNPGSLEFRVFTSMPPRIPGVPGYLPTFLPRDPEVPK